MIAFFSYLILAIFFAISVYALVGMVYLGFKTWHDDKTKVRKLYPNLESRSHDDKHPIAS
jgi:hypothetical protein